MLISSYNYLGYLPVLLGVLHALGQGPPWLQNVYIYTCEKIYMYMYIYIYAEKHNANIYTPHALEVLADAKYMLLMLLLCCVCCCRRRCHCFCHRRHCHHRLRHLCHHPRHRYRCCCCCCCCCLFNPICFFSKYVLHF